MSAKSPQSLSSEEAIIASLQQNDENEKKRQQQQSDATRKMGEAKKRSPFYGAKYYTDGQGG